VQFLLATWGKHFILTPSLGLIPCEYRYSPSDTPLKTRFFGLHFTRRMYRCIFNHFYVIGPKSYQILRNNAKYTRPLRRSGSFKVTDFLYHSKAHMWPLLVINTNSPFIRFAPFPSYGRLLVKFSLAIGVGVFHFNAVDGVIPCEYPDKPHLPKNTRMIVLPDAENRTIVSSLVWTKHWNVTDRRTDRQN